MKQTAVEWLEKELNAIRLDVDKNVLKFIDKSFEIAKEMEKQQIMDAFKRGTINEMNGIEEITSEQYYNETFKK